MRTFSHDVSHCVCDVNIVVVFAPDVFLHDLLFSLSFVFCLWFACVYVPLFADLRIFVCVCIYIALI